MGEIATESKNPMDQYHEDALQNAVPVEVPPGSVLESGYRLLHRGDTVLGGDERLVKGKWKKVPPREIGWRIEKVRGVRRRKTPEGHFQDLQDCASTAPLDKEEVARAVETLESVGTVPNVAIRVADPSASLKPFTPNKYTRYIPTLDGRKVPVDVYCVLAAFPTGSSAVDHAVKKLLAPGQRGHKDRIQDLKEARDSLTRAIELEEAVGPDA